MASNNSQVTNQVKVWLFPILISILGTIIWNDVKEIKSDVKLLMAQSNIDKTRIDNIEKQMERLLPLYRSNRSAQLSTTAMSSPSFPSDPLSNDDGSYKPVKELYIDSRQKKYFISAKKKPLYI